MASTRMNGAARQRAGLSYTVHVLRVVFLPLTAFLFLQGGAPLAGPGDPLSPGETSGADAGLQATGSLIAAVRAYLDAEDAGLDEVEGLITRGADVNTADTKGDTALLIALGLRSTPSWKSRSVRVKVARLVTALLDRRGLDPLIENKRGVSALSLIKNDAKLRDSIVALSLGRTALSDVELERHRKTVETRLIGKEPSLNRAALSKLGFRYTSGDFIRSVQKNNEKAVRLFLAEGMKATTTDGRGRPALLFATDDGSPAIVRLLLKAGADPNKGDDRGNTPLTSALRSNDPDSAGLLLAYKALPDRADRQGVIPLLYAAERGFANVVRKLIAAGADANGGDAQVTPLYAAAKNNHADVVVLLIGGGADPEGRRDGKHFTALHAAAEAGHLTTITALLDHGADVNAKTMDRKYLTPLMAAVRRNRVDAAQLLVDRGADINHRCPLDAASSKPDLEIARMLVRAGAAVTGSACGGTALAAFAASSDRELVEILLASGAFPRSLLDEAMNDAACAGKTEMVSYLLVQGADVNARCPVRVGSGPEPVLLNVLGSRGLGENDRSAMVALLLAAGAEVNGRSESGHTALHGASFRGQRDIAEQLIRKGAEVNAQVIRTVVSIENGGSEFDRRETSYDDEGYAALHWAVRRQDEDLVGILLRAGADPSLQTAPGSGITPLFLAVQQGPHAGLVKTLLEAGAEVNTKTPGGKSPLSVARRKAWVKNRPYELDEVVQLLIQHGARE